MGVVYLGHHDSLDRDVAIKVMHAHMWGKAEYAAVMARTRQLQPAYEAYDEGRKALGEKKLDVATAKAEEALKLFNGEAHFHALRGDIRLVEDNYDWAVTNYSRAIDRRDNFFYYHLQRGLARKELGQRDAAVADLERSLALLPTAPAHYALGDLARERGDLPAAIGHYKIVANSGGEYGKAAAAQVARLELPTNPGAYIPLACSADDSGNLIVSIRNDAAVTVYDIQIAVSYTDAYGRQGQRRLSIGRRVAPGEIASVNSGIGPYTAGSSCPAQVVAAQVED